MCPRCNSLFCQPSINKNCEHAIQTILKFYRDEEEIMNCVLLQEIFNLQACNQMSLFVHTYAQVSHKIQMINMFQMLGS